MSGNLTSLSWYLSVILVVSLVFGGFLVLGNELINDPRITLDNDSINYIASYTGYIDESGIDGVSSQDIIALKESEILTDGEDEGEPSVTDILGGINYYKNRIQRIKNTLSLVYNLPTLFVVGLGIPLGLMNHYVNTITFIIFIGFIVLLVKLVRGS